MGSFVDNDGEKNVKARFSDVLVRYILNYTYLFLLLTKIINYFRVSMNLRMNL